MLVPISFKSPSLRGFTSGPLVIVEYRGVTSVSALDELSQFQQSIAQKHGSISMLQFAQGETNGAKVEDGVRKRGAEMLKAIEKTCKGNALVIRGSSLGAMMMRTLVSGINAVSRSVTATKCFSNTEEALRWLQTQPGHDAAIERVTASEIDSVFLAKAA